MKYLLMLLCLASAMSSAEIYKCTDVEGKLTYSDSRCADDAEAIDVKVASSGLQMGAQGDWTGTINANRAREKERAIGRHQRSISKLMSARSARLGQLRRDQSRANNNAAGAAYRQSIATEMQAVTQDYNARIASERAVISDLKSQ
ncbi:DUF4124 domain-containing protein [Porticoccaceae bacterium]|nr:DUF4124 domain-containing protein [Porticoccaceae bacterium]